MQDPLEEFLFEYEYSPSPDSEEQLAQVWDLILALILEDFENEQKTDSEREE
jgi:hypothetical protein